MWVITILIAILSWGFTDLFSKMSVDEKDKDFYIKLTIWTGLAMGVLVAVLIPFSESKEPLSHLIVQYAVFIPPAVLYIASIIVGFIGLKYLELSVFSPVQNASGGVAMIMILIYYIVSGRISSVSEVVSPLDWTAVALITLGIILIAVVQQRLNGKKSGEGEKYRWGALALMFPLAFCIMDAAGTLIDNYILNGTDGTDGIGAVDYLILYNLAFFVIGVIMWVYLIISRRTFYNPFRKSELMKAGAGIGELMGNVFYIFSMALNPVLTAPAISAYCVVSVVLSRIILKEKLKPSQYFCVGLVLAGILIMAVSELIGVN